MSAPRILIAGIGNVFMGDDGFGVAVAQRLAGRLSSLRSASGPLASEQVVVMDAGIRGLDLTYALMDGYEAAILVDATCRGGSPGTLYVLDPALDDAQAAVAPPALLDTHGMDPARILAFLRGSGAKLGCLRVVGCEPASFGSEDAPQDGLSVPVAAAIDTAIELVESLVSEITAAHTERESVVSSSQGDGRA